MKKYKIAVAGTGYVVVCGKFEDNCVIAGNPASTSVFTRFITSSFGVRFFIV